MYAGQRQAITQRTLACFNVWHLHPLMPRGALCRRRGSRMRGSGRRCGSAPTACCRTSRRGTPLRPWWRRPPRRTTGTRASPGRPSTRWGFQISNRFCASPMCWRRHLRRTTGTPASPGRPSTRCEPMPDTQKRNASAPTIWACCCAIVWQPEPASRCLHMGLTPAGAYMAGMPDRL
jgi:hypothetical protein